MLHSERETGYRSRHSDVPLMFHRSAKQEADNHWSLSINSWFITLELTRLSEVLFYFENIWRIFLEYFWSTAISKTFQEYAWSLLLAKCFAISVSSLYRNAYSVCDLRLCQVFWVIILCSFVDGLNVSEAPAAFIFLVKRTTTSNPALRAYLVHHPIVWNNLEFTWCMEVHTASTLQDFMSSC